jgi:hypothetical protein
VRGSPLNDAVAVVEIELTISLAVCAGGDQELKVTAADLGDGLRAGGLAYRDDASTLRKTIRLYSGVNR